VPGVVVLENVGDRLPVRFAGRLELFDPCHPVLPCVMEAAPYMAVVGHASLARPSHTPCALRRVVAAAYGHGPLNRMARYAFRVPHPYSTRHNATQGERSMRSAG
jgi:hypothetical protein